MHSSRAAMKEGGDKKQLFELLNKMIIFHFKILIIPKSERYYSELCSAITI